VSLASLFAAPHHHDVSGSKSHPNLKPTPYASLYLGEREKKKELKPTTFFKSEKKKLKIHTIHADGSKNLYKINMDEKKRVLHLETCSRPGYFIETTAV
jgi:hypothetical protein